MLRTHSLDTGLCMSFHKEGRMRKITEKWPLLLCVGVSIYLAGAAFISGFSSCGNSYVGTQILGLSIIAGIGIGLFSYIKLHRGKSWGRRWLGGLFIVALFLSITTIFSAGGWVYYMEPQSLDSASHEFWQALQGGRCT